MGTTGLVGDLSTPAARTAVGPLHVGQPPPDTVARLYLVFYWSGMPSAADPFGPAKPLGTVSAPSRAAAHVIAAACWPRDAARLRVRGASAVPLEWLVDALAADGRADARSQMRAAGPSSD